MDRYDAMVSCHLIERAAGHAAVITDTTLDAGRLVAYLSDLPAKDRGMLARFLTDLNAAILRANERNAVKVVSPSVG